ncbi:MAG TPA: hypothetical protein VMT20_21415 [Terriglobia bacterium]|nr:hypothetical protein [Terriglobia bacterium]
MEILRYATGSRWGRAAWIGLMAGLMLSGAVSQLSAQNPIFKVVPSPSPTIAGNTLNAVAAVSAREAWAVGFQSDNQLNGARTLTEHWDGARWTVVPSPNPGSTPPCQGANTGNVVNGVAELSRANVWAVGFSFDCRSLLKPMILHFDGTSWGSVPSPVLLTNDNAALNGIAAISGNNIYAVGYQPAENGAVRPLVEHFDGHSWSVITVPDADNPGIVLTSVSANSANDVWAVGTSTDQPTVSIQTLVEHFDGTQWTIVPSPNPLPKAFLNQNVLSSVKATSPKDVTAAGFILDSSQQRRLTLIEHWDGAQWTVVDSPNESSDSGALNTLTGVSGFSTNDLYAVGFFANSSTAGQPETLVEHFDGTRWSIITSPTRGLAQHLNGVFALPKTGRVWAVGASSNSGVDPETGLLQLPLTLVEFSPLG